MQLRTFITLIGLLLFLNISHAHAFFSDTTSSPYSDAISELRSRGIVEGYPDGTFRPLGSINRAEFLKILIESQFPHTVPRDLRCFTDLETQLPQWYARTTCIAQEMGIVEGFPDGTFRPERTVQLDEALKMALLTFGIIPEKISGQWYESYLQEARARGILTSLLSDPSHALTRGEMAELTIALLMEDEDTHQIPVREPVCGNGVTEAPEQCDDGNVQDSDGCSSICLLVREPIRRAIVQIDQQTIGTLTTIASGQKNVTLLKFNAVSGRQDATLTSLVFEPSAGSLLYGQNYALMMDRDGDGIFDITVQATGKVQAGRLIFDAMLDGGIRLPKDLVVPFLVKADLVSSYGPAIIGLRFMHSLPDYIEAQGTDDGLALEGIETNNMCTAGNCFIRVNTAGNAQMNVIDRGNLFITEDSLPVRSHILLGSTITDTLLRLRLRAEGEQVDLQTIRIDGVISSVDALLLYRLSVGQTLNTGTMTPFAQASNGQCPDQPSSRFCAVLPYGSLVITPQQETVIAVVARMKSDQFGGQSNQAMTLTVASNTDTFGHAFEAFGVASTQELSQNNGNNSADGEIFVGVSTPLPNSSITGKTHDTAFASIASIINEGVTIENRIPSGFSQIASFKFAAFPHMNLKSGYDAVILQTLTLHVSAQNVQLDPFSFKLVEKNNPEIQLFCTAAASTGDFDVVCSGIQNSALQSRIEQGEHLTYRLAANVTQTQIQQGTSLLSVSLPLLGLRGQTNSVQWSDGTSVFTWVDIPETSVRSTVFRN